MTTQSVPKLLPVVPQVDVKFSKKELIMAVIEANDWLYTGEGVDLLYYYEKEDKYRKIIESIINSSRVKS